MAFGGAPVLNRSERLPAPVSGGAKRIRFLMSRQAAEAGKPSPE
jgi:hypothetical protein